MAKKPSAAQLRARAKFTKTMKSGGFKKKSKKKTTTRKVTKRKTTKRRKSPSRRRRVVKTTTKRKSPVMSDTRKAALLNDISKLKVSRVNKLKIVRCISKRLRI